MNKYIHYENVTRDILDKVKIGDLIRVNDWSKPMRVKAVSDNYFVMTQKNFGKTYYSVCSKLPWDGFRHNKMVGCMFHCGPDSWVFGSPLTIDYDGAYEFNNEEFNEKYLKSFEDGESHISERRGIAIYDLYIKSC